MVQKYYLFWVLRAFTPNFSSYDYFQMTHVYGVDNEFYGYLSTVSAVTGLVGVLLYSRFFSKYEMRNLQYVMSMIRIFSFAIDYCQINRYNLQWGISDYSILFFGTSFLPPLTIAMTFLPTLVMF